MSAWAHFTKDLALGAGMTALGTIGETKAEIARGKSAPSAFLSSFVKNNWMNVVLAGSSRVGLASLALPMVMGAGDLYTGARNIASGYNIGIRTKMRPFSSSFEHSDATMASQQRGMATINGFKSALGTEAAMLAQRYGRR